MVTIVTSPLKLLQKIVQSVYNINLDVAMEYAYQNGTFVMEPITVEITVMSLRKLKSVQLALKPSLDVELANAFPEMKFVMGTITV